MVRELEEAIHLKDRELITTNAEFQKCKDEVSHIKEENFNMQNEVSRALDAERFMRTENNRLQALQAKEGLWEK